MPESVNVQRQREALLARLEGDYVRLADLTEAERELIDQPEMRHAGPALHTPEPTREDLVRERRLKMIHGS